ncbi:TPA: hypothetical protein JZG41_004146 [Escherichia coli]|nr:hypothetical protein [Escherichia coli]
MNTKDTVTAAKLKKISKMEDALARQALREGLIPFYVRSMAIAEVTASAAGLIESLSNEISTLKAQLASAGTTFPVVGQRVVIVGNPSQEFIILSEIANGYLITPFPTNENKPLEDVRIVACDRVVFTDPAASSTFNA